jgi:hypothetical protein
MASLARPLSARHRPGGRSPRGKEKSMAVKKIEPAAETFVELLRQQIDILQQGEYEYQHLYIYTAGSDEPWVFASKITTSSR